MPLEIRILGPWEVAVDGRPVWLAGRLRTVLAVLAMSAGETVAVGRIIEALWGSGQQPPSHPRAGVQTYVARLRGLLGGEIIGTGPAGYSLRAEPECVDALRFAALLDQAGSEPDPRRERARLAEAQRLWRGMPFEGVESSLLHETVGMRLAERYLAAVERCIDLDLNLDPDGGARAGLAAELRELTSRHPLRESLWLRLIQVLQRSGRQAEALEKYEALRRRLATELGTDPGARLQAVYAELLAGEPVTAEQAQAAPHPADRAVPRELPADIAGFTGRRRELSTLDGLLGAGTAAMAIVAIVGPAGVGKTTLGVHWAHRVAAHFPDGQLHANLRGYDPAGEPRPPGEVMRGFLAALGVRPFDLPASDDAQAALYRSLLADRRMLVVLDNARDAEQVRPLLPGSAGCLVVVTSRDRLAGLVATEGARPVALDVLSMAEARGLLRHRLGAQRVGGEPEVADLIIRACARLPLALAVAAAQAALQPGLPLGTVARQLAGTAGSLDAFAGADPASNVRAVFSWSYRTLSPGAARLFRLLGLHPGPGAGADAAASLAGLPPAETQTLLRELVAANLVTEQDSGRYWYHDLLHAYSAEQVRTVDTQADHDTAIRRLLDHYVHTAYRAALRLDPNRDVVQPPEAAPGAVVVDPPDRDSAMAWFDDEHDVLLRALELARQAGLDAHVHRLAVMFSGYQDVRGKVHDCVTATLAALAAACRLADARLEAQIRCRLSRQYSMLHRSDEAEAELVRALETFRELGDVRGQTSAHHHYAFMLGRQGRHREALWHVSRELDLARKAGHRRFEAMALNGIGWFHAQLGELELAAKYCQAALDVHRELGNRYGEASTWDSLGLVHHRQGELGEAVECYGRSLELYRLLGDDYCTACTLMRLGDSHAGAGDTGRARAVWLESRRIFNEQGRTPELHEVSTKLQGIGGPEHF